MASNNARHPLVSSLTWRIAIGAMVCVWLIWALRAGLVDSIKQHATSSGTSPASSLKEGQQISTTAIQHDRPLILYSYAEGKNGRANFEFFVKQGLHEAADFVFIFNGETNAADLLPPLPNIKIVHRENKCFDLGSFGEVLLKDDLWKKYKRFITMNASVRGPFLPMYEPGCWSDIFLNRVTDEVKLVGTSMNCYPGPHVQSMLFATDQIGMSLLLDPSLATSVPATDNWGSANDPVGFTPCFSTLKQAVHSEIGITRLMWSQGYKVDSLLTSMHAWNSDTYCEKAGYPLDILHPDEYFGANVHPYELVFFKANRKITDKVLENLTGWHLSRNITSFDTCRG